MSTLGPARLTSIATDAAHLLDAASGSGNTIRVGVDVVSIYEFERMLGSRGGAGFVASRFTAAERAYAGDDVERLSARWAAKEAVAKAAGCGFRGLRPAQIEIGHEEWGQPTVQVVGDDRWPGGAETWRWSLSLAHEGDAAVAVALAVVPGVTGSASSQLERKRGAQ